MSRHRPAGRHSGLFWVALESYLHSASCSFAALLPSTSPFVNSSRRRLLNSDRWDSTYTSHDSRTPRATGKGPLSALLEYALLFIVSCAHSVPNKRQLARYTRIPEPNLSQSVSSEHSASLKHEVATWIPRASCRMAGLSGITESCWGEFKSLSQGRDIPQSLHRSRCANAPGRALRAHLSLGT